MIERDPVDADDLGWPLWDLWRRWRDASETTFASFGLGHAEFTVLAMVVSLVAKRYNATQQNLADSLGFDKMMLSRAIALLERRGYAKRLPSSGDRRAYVIRATSTGRRVLAGCRARLAPVHDLVFGERPTRELLARAIAGARSAGP